MNTDIVPCKHVGCINHVSHPCEHCGRIGGIDLSLPENEYLEFLYCVYKGNLHESRFVLDTKTQTKYFLIDAIVAYRNDTVFRNIYDVNKHLIEQGGMK